MATNTQEILPFFGKKTLKKFNNGELTEAQLLQIYRRLQKEANEYSTFGKTINDLQQDLAKTNNLIIKKIIQEALKEYEEKRLNSTSQNVDTIQKFDNFLNKAIGSFGLKHVVHSIKKIAKRTKNMNARILHLLLSTEMANVFAKKRQNISKTIYAFKDRLLEKLGNVLKFSGWRYGISCETGKNANYLIYCYLPNGKQLSWHTNNYRLLSLYPSIDANWDGQKSSTMTKLVDYVKQNYGDKIISGTYN